MKINFLFSHKKVEVKVVSATSPYIKSNMPGFAGSATIIKSPMIKSNPEKYAMFRYVVSLYNFSVWMLIDLFVAASLILWFMHALPWQMLSVCFGPGGI